jgi:electron transport complex protein RnfG
MHNKVWYMVSVLGVVGFVAGLALAGVNAMTKSVIEQAILREKIKPGLDKFFGPVGADNDYIADRLKIDLGRDDRGRIKRLIVFKGKKAAKVIGAAIQTQAAGFGGDIEVLTVFDMENRKILGAKTLSQSETMGMGARVADDSDPFIAQFSGMDYSNGIKLRSSGGEVDAISGATVSSAAFTAAVSDAVELLAKHNQAIAAQ